MEEDGNFCGWKPFSLDNTSRSEFLENEVVGLFPFPKGLARIYSPTR